MMPLFAPLYPPWPLFVYDVRWWSIWCEVEEGKIASVIPKCLKTIGKPINKFEIYVAQFPKSPYPPYNEMGIIVPVKYKDVTGSYWLVAYLDEVEPICAGREVIGIPKKEARIDIKENERGINFTVERKGITIVDGSCEITGGVDIQVPQEWMTNRFTVRVMPKVDNPSKSEWVVSRLLWEQSGDHNLSKTGKAKVTLGESIWDPLKQLQPTNVLGAIYYEIPKSFIRAGEVLERIDTE